MRELKSQKYPDRFENTTEGPTKVQVVDDDAHVRKMLCNIMTLKGYDCLEAADAVESRNILSEHPFAVVISDVSMPGESGIELARHVVAEYPDTALIMVSGIDDPDIANSALEIGAYGYMIKPVRASELLINISSALRRRKLEMQNRRRQEDLEKQVQERTEALQITMDDLRKNMDATIHVIGAAVEIRDPYTAGHQRRVAVLACEIATEMGLSHFQNMGFGIGINFIILRTGVSNEKKYRFKKYGNG